MTESEGHYAQSATCKKWQKCDGLNVATAITPRSRYSTQNAAVSGPHSPRLNAQSVVGRVALTKMGFGTEP